MKQSIRKIVAACLAIFLVVAFEKSLIAGGRYGGQNFNNYSEQQSRHSYPDNPNNINDINNSNNQNHTDFQPFIDLTNGIPPWISNYNNNQTINDPTPKTSYTFSYDKSTTKNGKKKKEVISYTSSLGGDDGSKTTYETKK